MLVPYQKHTTGNRAFRDDEPIVPRQTVRVFLRDSDGRFAMMRRKNIEGFSNVITGGIDEGETSKQAATREIIEETGYTDTRYIKSLGIFQELFWHLVKKRNQLNTTEAMLYELNSKTNQGQQLDLDEDLEVTWMLPQDILTLPTTEDMSRYRLQKAIGNLPHRTGEWKEIEDT